MRHESRRSAHDEATLLGWRGPIRARRLSVGCVRAATSWRCRSRCDAGEWSDEREPVGVDCCRRERRPGRRVRAGGYWLGPVEASATVPARRYAGGLTPSSRPPAPTDPRSVEVHEVHEGWSRVVHTAPRWLSRDAMNPQDRFRRAADTVVDWWAGFGRAPQARRSRLNGAEDLGGILNQVFVGLVQVDLEGRIVAANQRFSALVERPPSLLRGARFRDLLYSADIVAYERAVEALLDGRGPFIEELRLMTPEKSAVSVDV